MKRILVTGGGGFLGSHLCKRLIAQEKLAWTPNIHLQEGFLNTIEYFKSI